MCAQVYGHVHIHVCIMLIYKLQRITHTCNYTYHNKYKYKYTYKKPYTFKSVHNSISYNEDYDNLNKEMMDKEEDIEAQKNEMDILEDGNLQ